MRGLDSRRTVSARDWEFFMGDLIAAANVTKRFGSVLAVDHISFSVERGTICGFIGSDGAGKSTLLRLIAGMIHPDEGTITVDGHEMLHDRSTIKSIIGYMPQRFGLYQDLTVSENMDFFMDIFGIPAALRKEKKDRYLGFSNLLPFVERLAGKLSGGMKQKLGLACVLVHEPSILILDEPTNGVDPVSRGEFWEILFQMRERGMTLLVSTAYLDEGEKCDRLVAMHRSQMLAQGSPAAVKGSDKTLEDALIRRIAAADGELAHGRFKR